MQEDAEGMERLTVSSICTRDGTEIKKSDRPMKPRDDPGKSPGFYNNN